MEKQIFVYIDIGAKPVLAGTLWTYEDRNRQSSLFEYSKDWRKSSKHFALEPALQTTEGKFHSPIGFFGAISDSAPDRWGRKLIDRMEMRQAKTEGRSARTLFESDYLLLINDFTRQGALRFTFEMDGEFLATYSLSHIPPLVDLAKLQSIAQGLIGNEQLGPDFKDLFAPGSSLGGARPKSSVMGSDHNLLIAKFNSPKDYWDVELWEFISLQMASQAGIQVPWFDIMKVSGQNVLILKRFDRNGLERIPFLSAMSMLNASDGETRSYLEIGDAIIENGSMAETDLKAVWERIVFNILISNVDDHLRNHGFLWDGHSGWRLSPVYDLEPTPEEVKSRFLSTNITINDSTASIELAFEVAKDFGINPNEARLIANKIALVTRNWHILAKQNGVKRSEIELMQSAFEHEDLKAALKNKYI